jgi:hypothetical protein
MGKKVGDWYHYSGAIHVHTTESDGTKTLDEIAAIGNDAGLDFIMITDHMTLANREAGKEGKYGRVLVLVGYEHNDRDDNHHYLIFDSPGVYPDDLKVRDLVARAAADHAFGIIAHPDELKKRTPPYRSYPWIDWSVDGFQGIELWNQMSEWMDRLTPFNKLAMAFSPRKSMIAPSKVTLRRWDRLNRERKVVGVASPDAHAFPVKIWPLTVEIFPYKVHFRALRTHIILSEPMGEEFETAREQLYGALRDCRVFCSNMRWGEADMFEFYGTSDSGRVVTGGTIGLDESTHLLVKLPERARMKIIGNGEKVLDVVTDSVEYKVPAAGTYRVEAWKGDKGWIFSNHIRVVETRA